MSDAERPGGPFGAEPQGRPGGSGPQPPQPYGRPSPYGQQPGPYGPYGPPPPSPYGPQPPHGQQSGPYGSQQGQPGPYGPPTGPGPGGPYGPQQGPPNPYTPRPVRDPNGKKSRLPLILVAAGVALLLVIGLAVAALTGRDTENATDPLDPTTAPRAEAPSDAVRGYLEALAALDADRALGYLDDAPTNRTFLTRPVLEASAKESPITAVEVPEVTDEYAYKVAATYKLGKQSVTEDFSVKKSGGSWKLTRAVTELDLSYQRDETLPMKINGVAVEDDKVALFPGTYAFTTGSRWVSYGGTSDLTLTGPSDYDSPRLEPTLTKAGKNAFLKAAEAKFEKCLDQRKLRPKGCPNVIQLRPGQKMTQSSIRWSVLNDPFRNVKVALDYNDPTSAEATLYPKYRFRANGSDNGASVTYDGQPTGIETFKAIGDLSGNSIKVTLYTV